MRTQFTTDKFVLNLTYVKYTSREQNSKTSSEFYTKFLFPFECYVNRDFVFNFGDISSTETVFEDKKYKGYYEEEGKTYHAECEIISIEGNKVSAQISIGEDELPNWSKKLSELPLAKFSVTDIYAYCTGIISKKYPEVDFNFPRIYNKKYSPDQEVWDAFDGYLNDMKPDMSEMRRNYIDNQGNIFNVNIIHPMPYVLYLLKTSLADKGFTLEGDILADTDLLQKTVYSGTDYFTSKMQRRYAFNILASQPDELFLENGPDDYCNYERHISIEKPGTYKIAGLVKFWRASKMRSEYYIKLNDKIIWRVYERALKQSTFLDFPLDMNVNVTEENSVLTFYAFKQYHDWDFQLADLLITSKVLEDINNSELGDESGVITNLNEINLAKAVPNMTFGDFVKIITNWFNYSFICKEKVVTMNKLNNENVFEPKDWRKYEIKTPKRNLSKNTSYQLKFPEFEVRSPDSCYYDKDGFKLNGTPKDDTNIIEINGYVLPCFEPKPNVNVAGNVHNTANVLTDSDTLLQLVHYDGLKNGTNNATSPVGCHLPELFSKNWENWLRRRLNAIPFEWKFNVSIEEFSQFSINDYYYCYNQIHIITTIEKDRENESTYNVFVNTETIS